MSVLVAVADARLEARVTEVWALAGVRAGSGLVWWNGALLAVQDDALSAVRIDPLTRRITPIVLAGAGEALSKPEKPDLEAAFVAPDGSCYLLGSGSAPKRRRIVRLAPDGAVSWIEAGALYDAIASALGVTPNVEGAALSGDRLTLLHRGEGAGAAASAVLEVPFDVVSGPGPRVLSCTEAELGRAGAVALTFTDAAALEGRLLYLAAAEDTPNAIDDGPVVGVALGVIDTAVSGRWTLVTEPDGTPCVRKLEGLALDADGQGAYAISDPDDPDRPAELVRLRLSGPW